MGGAVAWTWTWTWTYTHLVQHPDSTVQHQDQEPCHSPALPLAPVLHPKMLHSQTVPDLENPRAGAAAAHAYLLTQPLSYHPRPLATTTESHSPDTRVLPSRSCRTSASARRIALCALGIVSKASMLAQPAILLCLFVPTSARPTPFYTHSDANQKRPLILEVILRLWACATTS